MNTKDFDKNGFLAHLEHDFPCLRGTNGAFAHDTVENLTDFALEFYQDEKADHFVEFLTSILPDIDRDFINLYLANSDKEPDESDEPLQTYRFAYHTHLCYTFEVEAHDEDEANEIAEEIVNETPYAEMDETYSDLESLD